MIREGTYAEFKGREYKISKESGNEYVLFFWKGKISPELEEFGYKEGFKKIEDDRIVWGDDELYERKVTPTEVGKVYSIRTYAK